MGVGLTALYALSDELHQAFTTGRSASLVDVGIDAVGAVLAVAAIGLVATLRRGRSDARPG